MEPENDKMSSPDIMVCIVAYNSSSPFTYLFIHSSLIYFNRLVHHFMAYFGKKVILLMFGSTLDQFGIFFFYRSFNWPFKLCLYRQSEKVPESPLHSIFCHHRVLDLNCSIWRLHTISHEATNYTLPFPDSLNWKPLGTSSLTALCKFL